MNEIKIIIIFGLTLIQSIMLGLNINYKTLNPNKQKEAKQWILINIIILALIIYTLINELFLNKNVLILLPLRLKE